MKKLRMLSLIVALCATGSVQAAVISWGTVMDYSSASDVSTEGALIEAINACGTSCMISPSINGVQFTASSTLMTGDSCTTFFYGDTGDSGYNDLLNTLDYGSQPIEVGVDLLEVDKSYLIQIWYVDERGSYDSRTMSYGDGLGNNSNPLNDQYVVGEFTADDDSQTIQVIGGGTGTPHINAYQIRLLGPVPTLSTTADDPVSGNFTVDIDFTEAVTGLDETDFSVVNGTVQPSSLSGAGANWSVVIIPAANGDVSVTLPADKVVDTDGDNHTNSKSNTLVVTYVSSDSDQPVPTLSTPLDEVYGPYTVDIDFTSSVDGSEEPVTGLELSDFLISYNGTLSGLSGSGASYSVVVTPTAGGIVTLSLPENSVMDTDGDNLQNSASNDLETFAHVLTTVYSPEDILDYLDKDDVNIKLAPGTYTINAAEVVSTFGTPRFEFWGNNSTYDFTGVTINFAADIYTSGHSMSHIQIFGNNNILLNLTMVDLCDKYGIAGKEGGTNIIIDGQNNRVEGFHMTISGSYPYGYGDCFGKGATYTIKHYKHCGLLVRGESNHVKNCTLIQTSYGHCIFMQAASNPTIEGCYVEGEMRTTDDMLAETSGPAYDIGFMTVWGYTLPAGYIKATSEEGIRAYNGGDTYIDGVWYERGTSNATILNNTLVNVRSGVTLTHSSGYNYVEGCTTIGCERGYAVGSGDDIVNCSGDAQYGPLYGVDYESNNNITADFTVLPYAGSHYNGSRHFAYIFGSGHNLTFRGTEDNPDQSLEINVGGDKRIIGMLAEIEDYSANNIVINNLTGYPLVLDDASSDITGQSCGTITDNGSDNDVEQIVCNLSWVNVALNGTATQSSTDYEGVASRAIDDNTSGVWSQGSVTHTDPDLPPHWWQVDLGAPYEIEEIQIYGRTDSCCRDRLSDYDVYILNCSGDVVWSNYQADYPDPVVFLDADGAVGRFVMIQLRNPENALSLAEVRVLSETPAGYCGDLTLDGKVNLEDFAVLSAGWLSAYSMEDLLNIANDWLAGTE